MPIPSGSAGQSTLPVTGLDDELPALHDEVVRLRAENARLRRLLEATPQQTTAEVHDHHDGATGVLASSLTKRAAGYTSLGFPDLRRLVR